MMHGYGYAGTDWFWMAPMLLFWIVVLALIVYGAGRFVRRNDPRSREL